MRRGSAHDAMGNRYDICLFPRDFMDNRQMVAFVLVVKIARASLANGFTPLEFLNDMFVQVEWFDDEA